MLRRALWAANLALFVLLGYLVADTVVSVFGTGGPGERGAAAALRPAAEPVSEPVGMTGSAVILNRNVFGVSVRFPRGPQPVAERRRVPPPAPPKARLKLLGTVVADSPLARAVILDEGSGRQDVYALGETVQGARVARIEPHAVHLLRGPVEEVLELDFPPAGPAPPGGAAERSGFGSQFGGAPSPSASAGRAAGRQSMAKRVNSIADILTSPDVQPYRVDGRIRGLLVSRVRDAQSRDLSGLQEGDVVSAVNGIILSSAEQARRAIEEAMDGSVLRLTLLRNGTERVVAYHLN